MKRWPFYTIFFLILLFFAGLAQAAPIGKITNLEGKVDVLKTGKNVATPASLGDPVDVGDIYRAKSNSKAEITFTNKNILRIAPNTRVEIKEYMMEKDQSSGVAKLHRGRAQIVAAEEFIKKAAAFAEGNKFEIHTPNAVAGIRGTNMIVFHERGLTGVLFVTGRGYVYNPTVPDKVVPVTAGNISFVTAPTAPPTPPAKASETEITKQVNAVTIPAKTTVAKAEIAEKTPETKPETHAEPAPEASTEAPKEATVVTTKEPAETVEAPKVTTTVTTEKLFQETTSQAQVAKTTEVTPPTQTTITSMQQQPVVTTTSTTKQPDVPPVTEQVTKQEPPVVNLTSKPDTLTNKNTATFTLTADKNVSFAYNLDSAGWVTASSGSQSTFTIQNIPEGAHTIVFKATDPLTGKFSETSPFSWKTDYTLPEVRVTQSVSPGTNSTSQIKVDFTTSNKPQGYVTYEYRFDNGQWTTVSGNTTTIQGIANGPHMIEYRARDKAGNTVSSSLSFEAKTYSVQSNISGAAFTGTSKTEFSILSSSQGVGQVSGTATNTGPYKTTLTLQGTLPQKINLGGVGSYWMENMNMNVSGDNVTGGSEFMYMSDRILATGTGTISGSKVSGGNSWDTTSTGTWNSAPLIFSGTMDYNQAFIGAGEGILRQGGFKGFLGTTNAVKFAGLGEFNDQGLRLFGVPVNGKDWNTGAYSLSGLFGMRLGNDTDTINDMKARMLGIYVKPVGSNHYEAGYLDTGLISSDIQATGHFYNDIHMWRMDAGALTEEKRTTSDIVSQTAPVIDYQSTQISGKIDIGDYYQGFVQGNTVYIKDQPWGIFTSGFGGYSLSIPSVIEAGGKIEGQYENGYWIARGDVTKTESNAFYGLFKNGNFLTNNYIGQFKDGEFFGTYENNLYAGFALSKYDTLPLTYNGELSESSFLYYGYTPTTLGSDGFINGIFGGRPYNDTLSIAFMGEYENPNERNVFLVPMIGAMAGGGSFYGYLGGIRGLDDSLEGRVLGIQIVKKTDGTYEAGYITSGAEDTNPILGRFYPSIGMWETTSGGLSVVNMAPTGIKPEEITENLSSFSYISNISGDIEGTSELTFINLLYQNWGMWFGKSGGSYTATPSPNWKATAGSTTYEGYGLAGYSIAEFEGKSWTDHRIYGLVTGRSMGHYSLINFSGDFLGAQDPSNKRWQAVSLGAYTESPLFFVSPLYADFKYNSSGSLNYGGHFNGLFGSPYEDWSNAISLGSYYYYANSNNPTRIWMSDTYSYDYTNYTYKAYGGGAFKGYIVGTAVNNLLQGKLLALYAKDGEIGYMEGDITGKTYPEISMYSFDLPTITKTPIPSVTGVTPDTLNSFVHSSYAYTSDNKLTGTFTGGGSLTGLIDATFSYLMNPETYVSDLWGIYKMEMRGTASNPASTWTGKAGGSASIGAYTTVDEIVSSSEDPAYWLTNITNGTWAEDRLKANLTGKFMTYTKMGDIEGTIIGTYNQDNSFQAVSLGKWKGEELKFFSLISTSLLYNNSEDFRSPVYEGYMAAFMGGVTSLWNGTDIPFSIMGTFPDATQFNAYNHYWAQDFWPYNAKTGKDITFDNGTYYGFLAGLHKGSGKQMEGRLYALYIDPEGNAGILKGAFDGYAYPKIGMWGVDGTVSPIQLRDNIGISPSDLPKGWYTTNYYYLNLVKLPSLYDNRLSKGFFVDEKMDIMGGTSQRGDTFGYGYLTYDSGFGIWQMDSWGIYDPQMTSGMFILTAEIERQDDHMFHIFTRNTWSGSKIAGSAIGAGGGWERKWTAVMAGGALGTYIESPDTTFGLLTTGAYLKTERFLSMLDETSTDYGANRAKLNSLGFPTKNIASVDLASLSLATLGTNITVKNVRLFSDDAGNIPYVWATAQKDGTTDGISGSYQGYAQAYTTTPTFILPNGTETAYTRISFQKMGTSELTGTDNWLAEVFGIGAFMLNNGSYTQGSWTGTAAGTYETRYPNEGLQSTSFIGSAAGLYYPSTYMSRITDVENENIAYLLSYTGSDYIRDGYFKGLLGGTPIPLWGRTSTYPSSFSMLGQYFTGIPPELPQPPDGIQFTMNGQDHIFGVQLYPKNFIDNAKPYTITDGGSYWGYLAGAQRGITYDYSNATTAWWSGPIEGTIATLFIDPGRKSGIILGRFGGLDPEDLTRYRGWFDANHMQWWAEGEMYPVELGTTSVLPENLKTNIASAAFGISMTESGGGFKGTEGNISLADIEKPFDAISYWINDVPYMGIWASGLFGGFVSSNAYDPAPNGWGFIVTGSGAETGRYVTLAIEGDKWTERKVDGHVAGAWADIKSIMRDSYTGIMVGKIDGTFDPWKMTYQTVMVGPWLETNKFLELAATDAGRKKLEALNIPSVVVGSATLAQQDTNAYLSNVAITNAQFFSTANGGKPILWAAGGTSGGVSGNYNGNPLNQSVALAGNGLTANFNMKAWDMTNNRWLSTITNGNGTLSGGSYTGPVQFQGVGAGTINQQAGSFSGTAAGISR